MREREFDNRNDHRVYVGNLPPDIRPREVEDLFFKYGKIVQVELKNKRGPPYAFVEFEDARYEYSHRVNCQLVKSKVN